MPTFRVEVLETRRYVYYVEAADKDEASDLAESADLGTSVSDSFEGQVVDGVTEVENQA